MSFFNTLWVPCAKNKSEWKCYYSHSQLNDIKIPDEFLKSIDSDQTVLVPVLSIWPKIIKDSILRFRLKNHTVICFDK